MSLSKPENLKLFSDLKTQKGDTVYTQAIDEYNTKLATELNNLVDSPEWNVPAGASDPARTAPKGTKVGKITALEKKVQAEIKAQYGVNTTLPPVTDSTSY